MVPRSLVVVQVLVERLRVRDAVHVFHVVLHREQELLKRLARVGELVVGRGLALSRPCVVDKRAHNWL